MATHSARLVLLLPVMVTLSPAGVRVTRSEAVLQVTGVPRVRAGIRLAVTVTPGLPVRTVGETVRLTKGPPPGMSPEGGGPVTAIRKTLSASASYLARTWAGSQSSLGPLG